jgi:hypothetical protein
MNYKLEYVLVACNCVFIIFATWLNSTKITINILTARQICMVT